MSESLLVKYSLFILFLPLLGFIVTMLLGKKVPKIFIFENIAMLVALVLSGIVLFVKLTSFADVALTSEFVWIDFGNVPLIGSITMTLGVLLDDISSIMIVIVMLISFLVHLFSVDYMKGDIRYNRYFAYLGLFTFSMAGIVITSNMLMMYIF